MLPEKHQTGHGGSNGCARIITRPSIITRRHRKLCEQKTEFSKLLDQLGIIVAGKREYCAFIDLKADLHRQAVFSFTFSKETFHAYDEYN
jgi:hypothetical protein